MGGGAGADVGCGVGWGAGAEVGAGVGADAGAGAEVAATGCAAIVPEPERGGLLAPVVSVDPLGSVVAVEVSDVVRTSALWEVGAVSSEGGPNPSTGRFSTAAEATNPDPQIMTAEAAIAPIVVLFIFTGVPSVGSPVGYRP